MEQFQQDIMSHMVTGRPEWDRFHFNGALVEKLLERDCITMSQKDEVKKIEQVILDLLTKRHDNDAPTEGERATYLPSRLPSLGRPTHNTLRLSSSHFLHGSTQT